MTRRELVKNTVGAIFGVSIIPAFGQKPKLHIPSVSSGNSFMKINWTSRNQLWISA